MSISAHADDANGVVTVRIDGDFTYDCLPALEQAISDADNPQALTLDFTELTFIDANVLNDLEPLLDSIRDHGRHITILSSSMVLSAF